LANGVTEIGDAPFLIGPEPRGMMNYQAFGVPWRKDDINERFKTLTEAEGRELGAAFLRSGGLPRWNGSLYYPAKIPELIGIRDRKYIDHTATHLHRGIGDLMRYAALVSFADLVDFGPHHMLSPETKRVQARLSDEALYALALYIYSLKGIWYRGHYLHDGSVASLEEMFDPDRLKETHKPGGWNPPGTETRAIKGHEFGLRLSAEERAELIAFLRTL